MHKLKRRSYLSFSLVLLLAAYIFTSSCISPKKIVYFNDLPKMPIDSAYVMSQLPKFVDPKIETSDVLAIVIQTIEQNGGNTPITSNTQSSTTELSGFLVDKNGYVELSLIGFVKVAGLTTAEAREIIKQRAKEFFKDPVVSVRFANFSILMLGDVGKAGPVIFPTEKGSIIDAISLAGDLQLSGKHKNVLLIRTEGEEKKFVRLDLTSEKIFQSPYFYLKQHDIIYVEPSKYKIQNSDQTFIRNLNIVSSVISFLSVILILRGYKF